MNEASARGCPYCGLEDHTGREHFQFVMSLSDEEQP